MGRHSKPEKKTVQEGDMARQPGPGKDFDDQYNQKRRSGQERAARGESHWNVDKKLNDLNSGGSGGGSDESCGKATVILLAALYGISSLAGDVIHHFA